MSKEVADVLAAAREKIEQGWTQNKYARDAAGTSVLPKDPRAVCWCSVGALRAVTPYGSALFAPALARLARHAPRPNLWNDAPERTKDQVLAAFRAAEAVERAETAVEEKADV